MRALALIAQSDYFHLFVANEVGIAQSGFEILSFASWDGHRDHDVAGLALLEWSEIDMLAPGLITSLEVSAYWACEG